MWISLLRIDNYVFCRMAGKERENGRKRHYGKKLADYFYQKRVSNDYNPGNAVIRHVDEVMKLLSVLTKSEDFVLAGRNLVKEGGNVTMCTVVEKIKDTSRAEGMAERFAEKQ